MRHSGDLVLRGIPPRMAAMNINGVMTSIPFFLWKIIDKQRVNKIHEWQSEAASEFLLDKGLS